MANYNYYGQSYGYPSYGVAYPATYQPMVQPQVVQGPQVQAQTPYVQQQTQPIMNQTPSGIIWISGIQEAQMYPVAPNNAVALWENSGKVIYLKQADATGKPTMRIYDLVERTETATATVMSQDEKSPDYATKDDLGKVVGVVKNIDDVICSLKSDVDTMKGDLYGVAGRKKSVKKAEPSDDDT